MCVWQRVCGGMRVTELEWWGELGVVGWEWWDGSGGMRVVGWEWWVGSGGMEEVGVTG